MVASLCVSPATDWHLVKDVASLPLTAEVGPQLTQLSNTLCKYVLIRFTVCKIYILT